MDLMTWLRAEWDRVLGFGLIALGAVLLVLGYLGVSNSPYVAEQLSYITSGGLGGLFLLGAGATLLILADLHDEWRKLDRVEAMLSGEIPVPAKAQTNGAGAAPTPAAARPALMAGASPSQATGAGLAPEGSPGPRVGPGAAAVFRRERLSLGIGLLLAVAVLFGSWARTSGVDQAKPAIAATGIAVFGLVLVALGAVGSTLTVKRHVQLRKARLFAPWLQAADGPAAAPAPAAGPLVSAPGLTRYHRPDCPSVAGLAVTAVDLRAMTAGLAPCRLCDPDTPAS
ncbi:MAG TPA: hypothetical protein VFE55_11745 [Acidimicrobiia bacterium]|nr:hypothetical protein [Acidimicrobiia bacterium]